MSTPDSQLSELIQRCILVRDVLGPKSLAVVIAWRKSRRYFAIGFCALLVAVMAIRSHDTLFWMSLSVAFVVAGFALYGLFRAPGFGIPGAVALSVGVVFPAFWAPYYLYLRAQFQKEIYQHGLTVRSVKFMMDAASRHPEILQSDSKAVA